MQCPEATTTLRFFRGELSDAAASRSMQHVHECAFCRHTFREAASSFASEGRECGLETAGSAMLDFPAGDAAASSEGPARARPGSRSQRLVFVMLAAAVAML